MTSRHYKNTRNNRQDIINEILNGDGNIIDGFIIDRGHPNGAEVHSITDTGVIIIHNYNTGKLITKLIARPWQIKRYYKYSSRNPPKYLLKLAQKHKELEYNLK